MTENSTRVPFREITIPCLLDSGSRIARVGGTADGSSVLIAIGKLGADSDDARIVLTPEYAKILAHLMLGFAFKIKTGVAGGDVGFPEDSPALPS